MSIDNKDEIVEMLGKIAALTLNIHDRITKIEEYLAPKEETEPEYEDVIRRMEATGESWDEAKAYLMHRREDANETRYTEDS